MKGHPLAQSPRPSKPPKPSKSHDNSPLPPADNGSKDIGLKARVAALNLIAAAQERRSGFEEALGSAEFNALSDQEKAFARALAMIVLRRMGQFNRWVDKKTKKMPPEPAVALIRLGLAQLGYMGVPDFAAVSTTMKLSERANETRPYKGLINALLRGAIREKAFSKFEDTALLPDWLYQRYRQQFGDSAALNIAKTLTEEPATDLCFLNQDALESHQEALRGHALGGLRLRSELRGELRQWAGYDSGTWWVQDAAASVPVALLGDLSGKSALDLCAAPGGKTLQLLAKGAIVVALDRSKTRLKRLEENLTRAQFKAECHVADAEVFEDDRQFDVVLLDAPCSATGTFRRQPDVLWATRPADIAKLADLQHRLLDSAAKRVKIGGQLLYCVCSMEREEGETQIIAFLRRHPDFSLVKSDPELLSALQISELSPNRDGSLRLLPHHREGGQDGFYVALLSRN